MMEVAFVTVVLFVFFFAIGYATRGHWVVWPIPLLIGAWCLREYLNERAAERAGSGDPQPPLVATVGTALVSVVVVGLVLGALARRAHGPDL